MGMRLADYVVNEAGFAADLAAEKYPRHRDAAVRTILPPRRLLVTTVQSIRNQGEGDLDRGLPNLGKHLDNLKSFGIPTIAAMNRFPKDSDADLKVLGGLLRGARDAYRAFGSVHKRRGGSKRAGGKSGRTDREESERRR